jgi:hypothetical protein
LITSRQPGKQSASGSTGWLKACLRMLCRRRRNFAYHRTDSKMVRKELTKPTAKTSVG